VPDRRRRYHVSSAVVSVAPGRMDDVLAGLAAAPRVEVHASGNGRIVVTIEGYSTGELGDRLTAIGLMDGVLTANMVFEHAEEEKPT
jgi:nitrate reductase NapD